MESNREYAKRALGKHCKAVAFNGVGNVRVYFIKTWFGTIKQVSKEKYLKKTKKK